MVLYQFWVTVTLTSYQVSRIIVFEAYLLHYLSSESQILCVVASWDGRMSCTSFMVTMTLTFFLELSYQEYISYIILGRNPKFGVWMLFGFQYVADHFSGSVTLTYVLVSRIIMYGAYCLHYLR